MDLGVLGNTLYGGYGLSASELQEVKGLKRGNAEGVDCFRGFRRSSIVVDDLAY